MLEQAAEGEAIKKLKEKHPDFYSAKPPKNASRKKPASKRDKVT